MCLVCARQIKVFFPETTCIYLKIFIIIIFLNAKLCFVRMWKAGINVFSQKMAILSQKSLPPQWDKKLKIRCIARDPSYLYYKTFLDICMKFFFFIFFCATLMHTQFLGHPYFAGENKQFLEKIEKIIKSTKMCLVCAHQ